MQERSCHLPKCFTSAQLGVQKAEKSHKAKVTGERLSTEKLVGLNNTAYAALERVQADHNRISKQGGGQGLSAFFEEVRALCTRLATYAAYKLRNSASSEMNRNRTAPSHTPTDPNDLDCFDVDAAPCMRGCLQPLLERMAAAEFYEPVLMDDNIMGVTVEPSMYGNDEIARWEQRRKFMQDLKKHGGPCKMRVYIFHAGGPHGSLRFAWRLPLEADRDDAKEAAAVATATAAAPLTASREMRRSFFERFSPAGTSPAVLKQMYQHLTGDSAAPENSKDKVGSS